MIDISTEPRRPPGNVRGVRPWSAPPAQVQPVEVTDPHGGQGRCREDGNRRPSITRSNRWIQRSSRDSSSGWFECPSVHTVGAPSPPRDRGPRRLSAGPKGSSIPERKSGGPPRGPAAEPPGAPPDPRIWSRAPSLLGRTRGRPRSERPEVRDQAGGPALDGQQHQRRPHQGQVRTGRPQRLREA